jgi:F-type H+-transporting ATPase subunit b
MLNFSSLSFLSTNGALNELGKKFTFDFDLLKLIFFLIISLLMIITIKKLIYEQFQKVAEKRYFQIKTKINEIMNKQKQIFVLKEETKKTLFTSKKAAEKVLERARKEAFNEKKRILDQANNQAKNIIEEAKKMILFENEKEKIIWRKKTIELAFLLSEKILEKELKKDQSFYDLENIFDNLTKEINP